MGSIRTFFYYKMHVIWGRKGRVCYKQTLTRIIRELAIIVLKSFFSCSGLAKSVSQVLYVCKYTVSQISVSSIIVTERGIDIFFFLTFHE